MPAKFHIKSNDAGMVVLTTRDNQIEINTQQGMETIKITGLRQDKAQRRKSPGVPDNVLIRTAHGKKTIITIVS